MRSERELQLCDRLGVAFLPDAPRWNRPGRPPRGPFPVVSAGRRGDRGDAAAGHLGLDARSVPKGDPDPRLEPSRDHPPSAAAVDLMLAAEQLDGLSA